MPSKEFILASKDAYRVRAINAERQHQIAHRNCDILMKFIKHNCKLLEVPKKRAEQEKDYIRIDDAYYLAPPNISETLN